MSRNLMARFAVAAVAIPIILWVCYEGGAWLFGMLLLLAIVGMGEFLIAEGFGLRSLWFFLAQIALIAAYGAAAGRLTFNVEAESTQFSLSPLIILIAFYAVSGMLMAMGRRSPAEIFARHSRLFWGVTYLSILYAVVYHVGQGWNGIGGGDLLLFLFGLLWVGDTAAMFTGKWLGRHKLAPTVSPNKTVEGFIGGIVGALAIGGVMFVWKLSAVGLAHVLVLSIGCSICGQLGDLVESMWKRSLGIKDSSAIIPGHGGVLDRFDSLLFGAPFMYAWLHFFV